MKPILSLLEYLRSGQFGPVSLGATKDKVCRAFGPADLADQNEWSYGDICFEFSFSDQLERISGPATDRLRFSLHYDIDPWKLRRDYPLTAMKYCLNQEGIVFDLHTLGDTPGGTVHLDLESGVSLEFKGHRHELKGFSQELRGSGRRPTCLLDRIVDTIPFDAFVLDHDARILRTSKPVHAAFGENALLNHLLSGKILRCSNAADAGGICGISKPCEACVLRKDVLNAITRMTRLHRSCTMNLLQDGVSREVVFLATVTPFHYKQRWLALLILENSAEIFESRKLAPVCCGCKRVQHQDDSWERIEDYLAKTSMLRLIRGICPSCLDKLADTEATIASSRPQNFQA